MRALVSTVLVFGLAGAASAQTPDPDTAAKQSRYQIGQMERMLEGAVEHAMKNTRDRYQQLVPSSMLISDNARARGFRLDGYGVFFDIAVPSMDVALPWSFRTLDQNDLGLENALKALRAHVDSSGDRDLQQALKRVELQVALPPPAPRVMNARNAAGAAAATVQGEAAIPGGAAGSADPIISNPDEAYRTEVKRALMDAMLDYSGPLAVAPGEWLTFAARRNEDRAQLAPADSDARTMVIRIKGDDLAAFRAGRLSREEALNKIEVHLF